MKLISYVLPVYNGQNNISECLESLLHQSYKNNEILVINDGSTDNTEKILDYYKKKNYRNLRIFTNSERKGAAKCRNFLNDLARGEIIAVCDVDIYYKDRSKAIIEFFKEYPNYSVFYSALHCRDSKYKNNTWIQDAYLWDFKNKCPISHPTVAYKKELSLKHKYHEDSIETDLYEFMLLDMHKAGALFFGCNNPLMLKIEGNRKRDKETADKIKKEKYLQYGISL